MIHKTVFIFSVLIFLAAGIHAQSLTRELNISGIKVILKPSANNVVSVELIIRGGTNNYTKAKEGIENAALGATSECGTMTMSRDEFQGRLESLGSSIDGSSTYDSGHIGLRCVRDNWDASWKLFADAVVNPSFDEKEFGVYKEKLIDATRQTSANPDGALNLLAMKTVFVGRNYAKTPEGTAQSLAALSAAEVKAYYRKILDKSHIVIIVVGKISAGDLKAKISKAFTVLPTGSFKALVPTSLLVSKSKLTVEERTIATNYIAGFMGAPDSHSPDFRVFQVAVSILYDRLFIEVRTKRNLSYAPSARVRTGLDASSELYVTTTDPNTTAKVMIEELRKIKTQGFTQKELTEKKSGFLTNFYISQESNAAQASALGSAEVLYGNWKRAESLTQEINAIKLAQINAAVKKYIHHIDWVYLGKKSEADPAVFESSTD